MKIKELFRNPIERRIEEVIKVDLGDEETVAYEISEYVVTEHIRRELERVLDAYQETITQPAEITNLWISGFFGSGKSSFAKVLGYLLENPSIGGKPAAERFFERVSDDRLRALLGTIHAQAPSLAVFVDLSSGRNVMREGESVVLPLYRALLERLDYSRDLTLAELEFQLEGDGDLEAFEEAFAKVAGERGTWRDRRNVALARNEASHALHLLRPGTYPSPDSWARGAREPEVTANSFVERALELLRRRGRGAVRLVFVVDEVGQYVARSERRMFDLMGLAHAVQKERGRIFLAVTSQEKLEDVVESLEGRRIELAKVRERFPLTVDLIPSDIEEVVARRVLDKRAEAAQQLRRVFQAHRNRLLANVRLDSPARQREFSEEEFVRLYPLLPYQIQLFIDAVSAHRARGGGAPMLGGSNRTIIKLAQQMVVDPRTGLAEAEVGALATAAMGYDLLEAVLPNTSWRSEVEAVEARHPGGLEAPVAKAVAVLSGVKALKLEAGNLAALLHPAVDAESLRDGVAQALRTLTEEEVLRATEEGYKLQSPEEKDWERERRGIDVRPAQRAAIRRRLLRELFEGVTVEQGRAFRVELRVDHERVLEGELSCVLEEREETSFEELRERSRDEPQTLFWAYEASSETQECADELHRSQEMRRRHQGAPRSAAETTLMGEERARVERVERRLRELLSADLLKGRMFFDGLDEEPTGGDVKQALKAALGSKVERIFPRLREFAAPVKAADALTLLRVDDLEGLPPYLGDEGLGILRATPEGIEIARDREPLATVFGIVEDRAGYGQEATGRYLEEHLSRPPFGATVDVVRVLLAALLRAGLVEARHQGARIANPRDPRLERVFGTLPGFRAATFAPQREVDPDMRARVAKRLQELTGERPSIAADQLAASLRRTFAPDGEVLSTVVARLGALGLEVPDLLTRARGLIREMEDMSDDEAIKLADEGWTDLVEARSMAQGLDQALDDEAVALLRDARDIAARGAGALGPEAEARCDKIRELIADPLRLAEGLPALRGLVREHRDAVREAWEKATGELRAAVDEALTTLRGRFAERVEPAVLEEALRPVTSLLPGEGSDPASGPPVEVLEANAERLDSIVERLAAELEELATAAQVVRIRVRDLYDGLVSSQEDLDILVERIRRAADEVLAQGKRFLLS
ncbi:MAG TPA: BREX system P-loop protein BrxC [Actinomycetota bacterium]|nr:BREX system P-loop protein BrxC [Actinomycetota bacterium]